MLSHDLKRLSATFDDWSAGRSLPDAVAWRDFQNDLRRTIAKAALIELGVDPAVFDIDGGGLEHGNVIPFPRGAS